MAATTQTRAATTGTRIGRRLALVVLAAALPLALIGCGGGGGVNPAAPAATLPSLHSASSGQAAPAATATPAPIPSDSQVVSARPLTGNVGPTGNVTVTVQFPEQVAPDAPQRHLTLVKDTGDQ